jgi:hypothetical protein
VSAEENKGSGHRTFTLIAREATTQRAFVDLNEPGTTPGDLFTERTALYDAKTGREVGTAFGRGIFIDIENNDPLFGFNATNKLEGGEIDTQGAARESEFDAGFTAAIIGGTGAFARARGTVTIRAIGDTVQFTYNVLP